MKKLTTARAKQILRNLPDGKSYTEKQKKYFFKMLVMLKDYEIIYAVKSKAIKSLVISLNYLCSCVFDVERSFEYMRAVPVLDDNNKTSIVSVIFSVPYHVHRHDDFKYVLLGKISKLKDYIEKNKMELLSDL